MISSDGSLVRLYIPSNKERARYVALSHCWGKTNSCITTKTNIDRYTRDIPAADIPKTFWDAIQITARLGISYLWIDSLCIVQDDAEDWQRESGQMATVYSDAYLSIAATRSTDDKNGFLSSRKQPASDYISVDLVYGKHSERGLDMLQVYFIAGRNFVNMQHIELEPLMTRGWCLQERLLSTRTLGFGRAQNYFECERLRVSETGVHVSDRRMQVSSREVIHPVFDPTRRPRLNFSGWYKMIELVSRRKFKYSSDQLPAMSGLARKVHGRLASGGHLKNEPWPSYYAGLWGYDLVNGLLWFATGKPHSVPSAYLAPSWSWAATDQAVSFMPDSARDSSLDMTVYAKSRAEAITQLNFIDVKTTLKGPDPFGQVCDGYIDLTTPVLELAMWKSPFGKSREYVWRHGLGPQGGDSDNGACSVVLHEDRNPFAAGTSDLDGELVSMCGLLLAREPKVMGLLVEELARDAKSDTGTCGDGRPSLVTVSEGTMVVRRIGVFHFRNWDAASQASGKSLGELAVRKVRLV